jgi:hypothetical protein
MYIWRRSFWSFIGVYVSQIPGFRIVLTSNILFHCPIIILDQILLYFVC